MFWQQTIEFHSSQSSSQHILHVHRSFSIANLVTNTDLSLGRVRSWSIHFSSTTFLVWVRPIVREFIVRIVVRNVSGFTYPQSSQRRVAPDYICNSLLCLLWLKCNRVLIQVQSQEFNQSSGSNLRCSFRNDKNAESYRHP